jgi:hypothetical protein
VTVSVIIKWRPSSPVLTDTFTIDLLQSKWSILYSSLCTDLYSPVEMSVGRCYYCRCGFGHSCCRQSTWCSFRLLLLSRNKNDLSSFQFLQVSFILRLIQPPALMLFVAD